MTTIRDPEPRRPYGSRWRERIFTRDLLETTVGWWVFSILFPIGLIGIGGWILFEEGSRFRWTELRGSSYVFFAISFVAVGAGLLGLPKISFDPVDGLGRRNRLRMIIALGIAIIGIVLGMYSRAGY